MVYRRIAELCYRMALAEADPAERDAWVCLGARFEELALADEGHHYLGRAAE